MEEGFIQRTKTHITVPSQLVMNGFEEVLQNLIFGYILPMSVSIFCSDFFSLNFISEFQSSAVHFVCFLPPFATVKNCLFRYTQYGFNFMQVWYRVFTRETVL